MAPSQPVLSRWMETHGQSHLSSGQCHTSNQGPPRDSLAPKLSGATSQRQTVLWVSGGNMALIPAGHHLPRYLLFKKSFLASCWYWESNMKSGPCPLGWTFPALYW